MSDTSPLASFQVTAADIRQWEDDLQRISAEIESLTEERSRTQQRIDLALKLAELTPAPTVTRAKPMEMAIVLPPKPVTRKRISSASTWQDAIYSFVMKAEMGVTFAELRDRLMASPLKERLMTSSKGYHNALSRLDGKKKIVRRYGRVFTPTAFKRFEKALAAGTVSAEAPQPFAHSPMGAAILKLVSARPGIKSTEIISELLKDPEFKAALTPHRTGAFNIISRLARRKQIVRRDDGGIIPGPQFPQDLLGQSPDEVGAPNGKAASAPIAGEVAPSPLENVIGFRLPR